MNFTHVVFYSIADLSQNGFYSAKTNAAHICRFVGGRRWPLWAKNIVRLWRRFSACQGRIRWGASEDSRAENKSTSYVVFGRTWLKREGVRKGGALGGELRKDNVCLLQRSLAKNTGCPAGPLRRDVSITDSPYFASLLCNVCPGPSYCIIPDHTYVFKFLSSSSASQEIRPLCTTSHTIRLPRAYFYEVR